MKNPLSNAAAKISAALARFPIQYAHLRGLAHTRRPPDRIPAVSKPKSPPAVEDGMEEMCGTSPVACARRRERARCAAIILSDAGKRNPAAAQALAFRSRMTRSEAVALLNAMPAAACAGLNRPRSYWANRPWSPAEAMFVEAKAPHASAPRRSSRPSSSRR